MRFEVDRLDGPELAVFSALNEPQLYHYFEPEPGVFLAETANVIERALSAGFQPLSMLVETRLADEGEELLRKAGSADISIYVTSSDVLKKITGYGMTHGMLCAMRRRALPAADKLLGKIGGAAVPAEGDSLGFGVAGVKAEPDDRQRIVVLEEVVNPANVGAIFRSAAALGMDAVLLAPGCADPLQRRAIRVSMGTVFQVPWTFLGEDWIEYLHGKDFRLAAMALRDEAIPVSDPCLKEIKKLALLMGSEGPGLRASTIDAADYTVIIPMYHGVDSLNVAAASAVACWELGKG